ncbi:MAG TPA: sigma-70 family RNA polymerase sigma factor [Acidimicrobiales bacterium]|nr:sigma-70 family RNA polymerase sigma factor [Acidimicrobiales bacterium]
MARSPCVLAENHMIATPVATELREVARRVASRLVSPADAEDIAQEAVLRATRDWARVGSYAKPWIVRVATNLAIAQLRRDGREHDFVIPEASSEGHADLRIDLAEAVSALPVRQRQAVVLRYLADHDEATVASLLGCSRGSVKRHLHRATQALRKSPRLDGAHRSQGATVTTSTHWKDIGFIAAVEPADGWPSRPWDHWLIQQDDSRDRVAVDGRGEVILDADGDEVMSGPGFEFGVVKVRPKDEPDPPEQPDPRPGAADDAALSALLDEALAYAAWFGHPWVGDEHLGLALAARDELPGVTEAALVEGAARFYEGPFAVARVAVVRERQRGAAFVRQPDANFSWTWSLNQTLANAASTSPADLAAHLLKKQRSFVALLLAEG